ncbi:MAG: hypothetical protein GY697_24930 [Desulfobacterales bacterium]|nr:hypothetical protein [Desulfobacterales bacterium]
MTLLKTTILASLTLMIATASAQEPLVFSFTKIAQTGDTVPGTSRTFTGFRDPAVDDSGNVAFGDYNDGAPTEIKGTFGTKGGTLIKFSDETTPFPGAAFTLNNGFDDHVEIRNGIALSYGENEETNGIENDILFTSDGKTGRLVAQEGVTELPSTGNPTITHIPYAEGFGFDGTRVAFTAEFGADEGVYLDDGNGTLFKIADTSDTTPAPANDTFTDFDEAMPDSNGDGIVFWGETDSSKGIYVSENGVLSKVADNLTDFAPEVGSKAYFYGPGVDGGSFAFIVAVKETGTPYTVLTKAVILADGNSFTTVADLTTMLPTGEKATDFSPVAIANGSVAFKAVTSKGDSVFIWRDGVFHTVLSEGDTLDGLQVTEIKEFNRTFFADGFMALVLKLSDGSNAIYRVSIDAEKQCYVIKTSTGRVVTFCL